MPPGVRAEGSAPAASSAAIWRDERRTAMPRSSGAPQLVGRAAGRLIRVAAVGQQQFKGTRVRHVERPPRALVPPTRAPRGSSTRVQSGFSSE